MADLALLRGSVVAMREKAATILRATEGAVTVDADWLRRQLVGFDPHEGWKPDSLDVDPLADLEADHTVEAAVDVLLKFNGGETEIDQAIVDPMKRNPKALTHAMARRRVLAVLEAARVHLKGNDD